MTSMFNHRRPSSNDDQIDQCLNDWVAGTPTDATCDAIDPLDFHRWADETLRSDPAATGPAAGSFNRVLRNFAPGSSHRSTAMTSATLTAANNAAIVHDSKPFNSKGFDVSRFINLAATLAIVVAVTLGGWFAMSQRPGGGDDQHFAGLQATPESGQSQTCDVEPLTVDEVMAIVENPWSAMNTGSTDKDGDASDAAGKGLLEGSPIDAIPALGSDEPFAVPEEADFASASDFLDDLIACENNGTIGQMWALQSPLSIQQEILSRYPVYRDKEEIQAYVEETIDQPYPYGNSEVYPEMTLTANPRVGDARIWVAEESAGLDYSKVMYIGIQAVDSDGELVVAENFEAVAVEGDMERGNGVSYILVYSESQSNWYFYAVYAPGG